MEFGLLRTKGKSRQYSGTIYGVRLLKTVSSCDHSRTSRVSKTHFLLGSSYWLCWAWKLLVGPWLSLRWLGLRPPTVGSVSAVRLFASLGCPFTRQPHSWLARLKFVVWKIYPAEDKRECDDERLEVCGSESSESGRMGTSI